MSLKLKQRRLALQSLLTVYGLNRITITKIIGVLKLHPLTSFHNLYKKRYFLNLALSKLKILFQLRHHVFKRILLTIKNLTYRGIRHLQHLPVRGQRTHTNAGGQKRLHKNGRYFPYAILKKEGL